MRRDRDRRPKCQDTSSSEEIEEPAYGKVQHSPIINRNRTLPSLSHEVLAPDTLPSLVNDLLPAANSTQLSFSDEETTVTGNLMTFEEPTENTILENDAIIEKFRQDLLSTPSPLPENTENILQPTIIQSPARVENGRGLAPAPAPRSSEPGTFDYTADPYPSPIADTDTETIYDLEESQPKIPHQINASANTLTTEEGHYVHFMSADCNLVTPVGKLLLDTEILNKSNLLEAQPKKGQVVTTDNGFFKTFSIVISDKFHDNIKKEDVRIGLKALKHTLTQNKIKSFRLSASGDLHKLPTKELFNILEEIFEGTNQQITLCNCTIITLSIEDRQEIINEAHDSLVGGHKGVTKTYKRIRSRYQWPEMRNEIQDYIRKCQSCQEQKLVRAKTRQPMLITDTPMEAFDKIALDTVGPLPVTPSGNKYILTMQDNLTKYCIAVAIPNIRATTIADAFARHFIAIYGTPRAILTDKGTSFIGNLMTHLSEIFKIKQITTSGYRPQTNGSLERSHIVLAEYLKHYMDNYEDWDLLIPFAMFSYNTSVHEATNFTPYELIFGKPAREPSSFPTGEKLKSYGDYLTELISHMIKIRNLATDNLNKVKIRSKDYYDRHSKPTTFKTGDFVYALKEPRVSKFDPHYIGPYKVIDVTDLNNVVLETHNRTITKHQDKLKHAYFPSTAE